MISWNTFLQRLSPTVTQYTQVGQATRIAPGPAPGYAPPMPDYGPRSRPMPKPKRKANPKAPRIDPQHKPGEEKQPWFPPELDPIALPPLAPQPFPWTPPFRVRPLRRPNPWRSPTEQPQRGPRPNPRRVPRPTPEPVPGTVVRPGTGLRPGGPGIAIRPIGPPVVAPPHRLQPPPRRDRERKKRLTSSRQGLERFRRALGKVTEGTEVVDCAYGSLPEALQKREQARRHGKNPSLVGKLRLIYEHFDEIDWADFVQCVSINEAQDRAIAHGSKKAGEGLRKAGYGPSHHLGGPTRIGSLS